MLFRSVFRLAPPVRRAPAAAPAPSKDAPPFTSVGVLSLMEPVIPAGAAASAGVSSSPSGGSGAPAGSSAQGRPVQHLALDGTGFIGGAMRLLRVEAAAGRERDISRVVAQQISSVIRRFGPSKSVAIFMDGAEPLWRVARTRAAASSKRTDTKQQKLPAGPLVTACEEAVLEQLLDDGRSMLPPVVVFSPSTEAGAAELKMGAWSQYLFAEQTLRETALAAKLGGGSSSSGLHAGGHHTALPGMSFTRLNTAASGSTADEDNLFASGGGGGGSTLDDDAVAFFGSTDSYYLVGSVPHRNSFSVTQVNAEFKGMSATALRRWLGTDVDTVPNFGGFHDLSVRRPEVLPAAIDVTERLRHAAEMTLLLVLAQGHGPTEVAPVNGLSLKEVLKAYSTMRDVRLLRNAGWTEDQISDRLGPAAISGIEGNVHLLEADDESCPGPGLARTVTRFNRLNLRALAWVLSAAHHSVLSATGKGTATLPQGVFDAGVAAWLHVALETTSLLTEGVQRDPLFTRSEYAWAVHGKLVSDGGGATGSRAAASLTPPSSRLLLAHLLYIVAASPHSSLDGADLSVVAATPPASEWNARGLTAAEYAVLTASSGLAVRDAVTRVTGLAVRPEVAAKIASDAVPEAALEQTRRLLRYANPRNPNRSLVHSPTLVLSPADPPAAAAGAGATARNAARQAGWRTWPVDMVQSADALFKDADAAANDAVRSQYGDGEKDDADVAEAG